jgi:hypothetical protein
MTRSLALATLLLAGSACGSRADEQPSAAVAAAHPPRTQRQRDSAIAASAIPGARGVAGALRAADALDAQTRAADSVGAER